MNDAASITSLFVSRLFLSLSNLLVLSLSGQTLYTYETRLRLAEVMLLLTIVRRLLLVIFGGSVLGFLGIRRGGIMRIDKSHGRTRKKLNILLDKR